MYRQCKQCKQCKHCIPLWLYLIDHTVTLFVNTSKPSIQRSLRIATEHSAAKQAELIEHLPETHSSVQAYSFLTLLLTIYTKSLYICSFYTFPVNFSLQVDAPYILGKRTFSQFAFKSCLQNFISGGGWRPSKCGKADNSSDLINFWTEESAAPSLALFQIHFKLIINNNVWEMIKIQRASKLIYF